MKRNINIVGAGLAGLIAAHAWPSAEVLEASPAPRAAHRALLRFRTDAVARLVGVEFRKVRVHKGIWADGAYHQPAIRWANLYAQKVLGVGQLKGDRSIWSLDPVDRFIAPDDLYEQLVAAVSDRIHWDCKVRFADLTNPVISTAPMPVVLGAIGVQHPLEFHRAPITVWRCKVPGADVFQTVYFPSAGFGVYRASLTGETMIIESTSELGQWDVAAVEHAFGIKLDVQILSMERVEQRYGKIAPVDDSVRKQLLFKLTHEHKIYSLGRFATWRNILLDDVVADIDAIKRLLKADSAYDTRRAAA
jgi:hypothetical protein